nr:MAG TPA: hypothetical protein [Caudoviricetes sp.]
MFYILFCCLWFLWWCIKSIVLFAMWFTWNIVVRPVVWCLCLPFKLICSRK